MCNYKYTKSILAGILAVLVAALLIPEITYASAVPKVKEVGSKVMIVPPTSGAKSKSLKGSDSGIRVTGEVRDTGKRGPKSTPPPPPVPPSIGEVMVIDEMLQSDQIHIHPLVLELARDPYMYGDWDGDNYWKRACHIFQNPNCNGQQSFSYPANDCQPNHSYSTSIQRFPSDDPDAVRGDCNDDDEYKPDIYYKDKDGDGYVNSNDVLYRCNCDPPAGSDYVLVGNPKSGISANVDCNDNNEDVHAGAREWCAKANIVNASLPDYDTGDPLNSSSPLNVNANFIDYDCDGNLRDGCQDADNDGYYKIGLMGYTSQPLGGRDCDDNNSAVNPAATEIANDGIDNNCMNGTDETNDNDGDGVIALNDCDESNPNVYPGAPEYLDFIDNDCDGLVDLDDVDDPNTPGDDGWVPNPADMTAHVDDDHDGFPNFIDCDDADGDVHAEPCANRPFATAPICSTPTQTDCCRDVAENDCADTRDLNCDGFRYAYQEQCAKCIKGHCVGSGACTWQTLLMYKDSNNQYQLTYTCPSGVECEVAHGPQSIKTDERNIVRVRDNLADSFYTWTPPVGPSALYTGIDPNTDVFFEGPTHSKAHNVHSLGHYSDLKTDFNFDDQNIPKTKSDYMAIPEQDLISDLSTLQSNALMVENCRWTGTGFSTGSCQNMSGLDLADSCAPIPSAWLNYCNNAIILKEKFCESPSSAKVRMALINCKDEIAHDSTHIGICNTGSARCEQITVSTTDSAACVGSQFGACVNKGTNTCPTTPQQ